MPINQQIEQPDLEDLLESLKDEIFAQLNVHQIGKIESVDLTNQTVSVRIQVKRRTENDGNIINYPLILDCPFFVIQGGSVFLNIPPAAGDYCLLLFNDRNINTWWDTANVTEPPDLRKHSLSDAIALVGINPRPSPRPLEENKAILDAGGLPVEIRGGNLDLLGGTESFVKGDTFKTALDAYLTTVGGIAPPVDLTTTIAAVTTMITAASTFKAAVSGMLSATIKGE